MKPKILEKPLPYLYVTQLFGYNYYDFYSKMGMKGHNGIDMRARTNEKDFPVLAAHDGVVSFAGDDGAGGNYITLWNKAEQYKTIYAHLLKFAVKQGDEVKAKQIIGYPDNTGTATTGDHLHFGLKETDKDGNTINWDNGYFGAVDPEPYFRIDWLQTPAYQRYGQKQNWLAEFNMRFTPILQKDRWSEAGRWIQRQLKARRLPLLNGEQANAIIYGAWDFEYVINPAMHELYAYMTKEQYKAGAKAFG